MDNHKHFSFRKEWDIDNNCAYIIGECDAYIRELTNIPLKPVYRDKLLLVSLIKGAQATTAIEGNTLSEDEIKKLEEGWSLPASKEYLGEHLDAIPGRFRDAKQEIITMASPERFIEKPPFLGLVCMTLLCD